MFYFLSVIAAAMILYGIRGIRKERDSERRQFFDLPLSEERPADQVPKIEDQDRVSDLTVRMTELEKSLFEHLLKWQMEKEELLEKMQPEKITSVETKREVQKVKVKAAEEEKVDEVRKVEKEPETKKKPMPENIRKVMDYEKEGLSVQEIAKISRMNKGEVLLLKNLSKHYRK